MDKLHKAKVRTKVLEAASTIDGRLPTLASHPNGRIPIAHLYQVLKTVLGCTIDECPNSRIDDVFSIIDECVDHVDIVDVSSIISNKYQPVEKHVVSPLDEFFR